MASPFKFFRRHQTQLLVVIGLLTMVAFIILPSVLQQLEVMNHSSVASNVVFTKKYGNLTALDIQHLQSRQYVLMGFVSRVAQAYQTKLREHQSNPQQDKLADFYKAYTGFMAAQQLSYQIGDASKQSVVSAWLFENKAREMGLVVNDAMINEFINKVTSGLDMNAQQLQEFIVGDKTGYEATQNENALFDAINGFLLRMHGIETLGSSLESTTTGERLDSFCRLAQRANIEAFPVKVEDFVEKVAEPTEGAIAEFFDTYKDKDADLDSKEPGLRQPQKIALEYCAGTIAAFMDTAAITDEQIQKNYDENKDNYVVQKTDEQKADQLQMPKLGLKGVDDKEYRPLDDKLKDEIRNGLAYQAAREKLQKAIGAVQKAMNDYSIAKDMYEMKFTEQDRKKPVVQEQAPKPVDFDKLAKENKLTYVKTDLLTPDSFMDNPIALTYLEGTTERVPAGNEFFGKTPLLQSKLLINNEQDLFVAWKTEDVAAHTPTLKEDGIKVQAIDQIKYIKARELAKANAQELVKKAVDAKLPLKSCLGDAAFVPTQFTWMTLAPVTNPNMERRIYLSPIEGIQQAGFDFMNEIFQMKAGEIKTVANESESVYYVIRMIELNPPTEQLYARFIATPDYEYAQSRNVDGQLFFRNLYQKLEKDAGLKWAVQPDEESEREE